MAPGRLCLPDPLLKEGAAQGDSIPRERRSARRGDRTPVAIWRNGGTIPAERQGSKGLTSLAGSRGAEPSGPGLILSETPTQGGEAEAGQSAL